MIVEINNTFIFSSQFCITPLKHHIEILSDINFAIIFNFGRIIFYHKMSGRGPNRPPSSPGRPRSLPNAGDARQNPPDAIKRKIPKQPAPASTFIPPYNLPEGTTMPHIEPLLSRLPDDKLNMLMALFNVPYDKLRNEKISIFVNELYPKYVQLAPKLEFSLISFIDQLFSNNDLFNSLKLPLIPSSFTPTTVKVGSIVPVQFLKNGIDIDPPPKVGKQDVVVIGRLITPFHPKQFRVSIKIASKDTLPVTYGEPDSYFYGLYSYKRWMRAVHITFPASFENFFAFFSVQYCVKKPIEMALRDILKRNCMQCNDVRVQDLFVRSTKCQCKSFPMNTFVEETLKTGHCKCPYCNCELTFKDIQLDMKKREILLTQKNPDLQEASLNMSKVLCFLMRSKNEENSWGSLIFDNSPKTFGNDCWEEGQSSINDGPESYLKSYNDFLNPE